MTFCHRLKLVAQDGKLREADVLNTKGILRLVQSIPSPKAEPFKLWLAQVGSDRLDEIADPEKAIIRGADFYRAKGYTEGWINQRLQTGLEWTFCARIQKLKGLKKENLRDNMTNIELVLNMLAEVTTTALSKQEKPQTFKENKNIVRHGENVANTAKQACEEQLKVLYLR